MAITFHDISHYEGLDYRPTGPLFAKATEGTANADPTYPQNRDRTLAGGWPFAGYHFLHAGNIAAQAAWAFQHIGRTPAMLDVERPASGPAPTLADVTGFVDAYRALGGVLHLAYIPRWFWLSWGQPSLQPLIDRGVALIASEYTTYSDDGPGWRGYGGMDPQIWQYTSTPIDTNAFKGTVAELAALMQGDTVMPLELTDKLSNGLTVDGALVTLLLRTNQDVNVAEPADAAQLAALAKAVAAIPTTGGGATPLDITALAAALAPTIESAVNAAVAPLSAQVADLTSRLEKAVAAEAAALNGGKP